jgi:hypothetical protein
MLTSAHPRGVTLRPIEPGKPNRNAYLRPSTAGFVTSA